jgi:acylglycerol lipase
MKRRAFLLAGLATLSGCGTPAVQRPRTRPVGFKGPSIEQDAFVSFDGARLGLTVWPALSGEPQVVIIGLHGMNDYAQAFWMAGPWWAARGITTYAYDQRGFGRSPERGVWADESLGSEDLRTFCALVRARHPTAIVAVVGESMGGAFAVEAFASDRPPDADRLVLLAPAVWGWSSQPFTNRVALWTSARVMGSRVIEPPRFMTSKIHASDNMPELYRMGRDPMMIWGARPDAVYGLVGLMERAGTAIALVKAPTAYLYGAHDDIIPEEASFRAAALLKASDRTIYYPRGWHLLLRDYQAAWVWADVEGFIRDPKAQPPSGSPPIPRPERERNTR